MICFAKRNYGNTCNIQPKNEVSDSIIKYSLNLPFYIKMTINLFGKDF